jgi:hypothetical protein
LRTIEPKKHHKIDLRATKKASHRPFIFLLALLLCNVVHGDGDGESEEEVLVEDWFDLIRYLMGLAFLIFGIFFVLYSVIATYSMLRCYNKTGRIVTGEVLPCTDVPGHVKKFEIEVLYSADTPQFKDSRNKFRYPDAMETKEYLRRFQTDLKTPRGSMIELITLPGIPTSACTSEMIGLKLNSLSKCGHRFDCQTRFGVASGIDCLRH